MGLLLANTSLLGRRVPVQALLAVSEYSRESRRLTASQSKGRRSIDRIAPSHSHPKQAFSASSREQSSPSLQVDKNRILANRFFPEYNLQDKVIVVTGGGRGLGLTMASALYQGGALVHCLDRLDEPHPDFSAVQRETDASLGGSLEYHKGDIRDTDQLQQVIADIAAKHQRLDGCIAAAGVQKVCPALDYKVADIKEMLDINYIAVYTTAQEVARQMLKWKTPGSMILVASMSAMIANRGLITSVYNSSKAAVYQLARNLAMEWGAHGIRVNSLCPGHILTPMVQKNFDDEPWLREQWEKNSMLGRISSPEEFRGAATFLLSNASSFMTGSALVIDGGHTAW